MKSKKNIKSILFMAIIVSIGMFFINMSFAATTGKINVETANLRKEANADSSILEQLSLNEEVEILEKAGEWYQVKNNGMTGFIKQDLITTNEEVKEEKTNNTEIEQTATNTEEKNTPEIQEKQEVKQFNLGKYKLAKNTKLRIVPSINATETIEIKQDEEVNAIEIINGWVCVEVNNTKGWIRQECLKAEEEQPKEEQEETETAEEEKKEEEEQPKQETVIKTQYIGKETVNLRKEPNTSSEIITSFALNTTVEVYSEEDGWSKVKINGKEGYISSSLLSDSKQETSRNLDTSRRNNTETTETAEEVQAEEAPAPAPATSGVGSTVVETALQYTGSRYVYGGSSPSGFDCSGFTSYIYGQHGVSLNRTAQGQFSNGVAVSRDELQPGDLVMFGSSSSNITHVGIYMGGGQIVHAANPSRGVTTDTINSGYYNNKYVGARRVN